MTRKQPMKTWSPIPLILGGVTLLMASAWLIYSYPIFCLLWMPWPLLSMYAQHRRHGSIAKGAVVGLIFGPLGLLVANYSGGSSPNTNK